MQAHVTDSRPFPARFLAYLRERYDPVQFVPFHLLMAAAAGGLVRLRLGAPADTAHLLSHGALALMLLAFYFVLRVFDEHKDWEEDRRAYPERLLSRGVVTHRHLRAAAWVAVALMFGLALPYGLPMVAGVAVVLGYSLLMLREFFVGSWLRQRMILYGLSHNVVVFLSLHLVFLGFGLATGAGLETLRDPFLHGAALAINALVFSLELARKIRTPDAEREGVDTYSQVLGTKRAALLLLVVQGAGAVGLGALLIAAGAPLGWVRIVLIAAGTALLAAAVLALLRRPTPAAAERLVKPAGVAVLLCLLAAAL
jgi:hypothetical protein